MEKQQLISEFDKNSIEKVKVHLSLFNGSYYVDVRAWVMPKVGEGGSEIATKKGLTLHVELIPDLMAALQKAGKAIQIKPVEATGEAIS